MKIAMLCPRTPRLYFSGIENYVRQVSRRLIEKGYAVEIFTTSPNPSEESVDGVLLREFPAWSPSESYHFSPRLFLALRKSEATIIHAIGYNNLVTFAGVLAKKPNQKLVVTMASAGSSSSLRQRLLAVYDLCLSLFKYRIDKIICLSEFEYAIFSRKTFQKGNLEIIPLGADIEFFRGIMPNKKSNSIISIGRLVKNKGFRHLLRAFKLLLNDLPGADLKIVGSGTEKKSLLELTEKLGVEKKVTFKDTEDRRELITWLKESELFVLLSNYESPALVVLEALVAGVPVLITDNSALSEFIRKGYAVGVEDPSDSYEVSKKMKMILNNPSKYIPEGPEILSWDEVVERIIEVYERLR